MVMQFATLCHHPFHRFHPLRDGSSRRKPYLSAKGAARMPRCHPTFTVAVRARPAGSPEQQTTSPLDDSPKQDDPSEQPEAANTNQAAATGSGSSTAGEAGSSTAAQGAPGTPVQQAARNSNPILQGWGVPREGGDWDGRVGRWPFGWLGMCATLSAESAGMVCYARLLCLICG
jgi:hypothetical protein